MCSTHGNTSTAESSPSTCLPRPPAGGVQTQSERHAEEGALGIYTKYSSPPPAKPRESRQNRYRLQGTARQIAIAEGQAENLEFPHDYHRVAKCKWTRVLPEVRVKLDSDSAFYSGLTACGSVWACPVCSAKVQQARRDEIAHLIAWAKENGKQAVMVTFTHPHKVSHSLEDQLKSQADALRRFRSGKAWQKFKNRIGFVGMVRTLEVTYGRNGWHPHTHELWIVDAETQPADVKIYVQNRWLSSCQKAGLVPPGKEQDFLFHAVNYHFDADSSDYLAKQDDDSNWSIAEEMTLSSMKKGGNTVHPFALLQWASEGDRRASRLFLEYMQGMHGKRQVHWSRGLKELTGVNTLTDEEAAELEEQTAKTVAVLEMFAWKFICTSGSRSHVLDLAETGGSAAIAQWLSSHGYDSY
jgi:hypothetical protein